MRGTEISAIQIAAAGQFLMIVGHRTLDHAGDRNVTLPWDSLVQVVAWYAAVRVESLAEGDTLDTPGKCFISAPLTQDKTGGE